MLKLLTFIALSAFAHSCSSSSPSTLDSANRPKGFQTLCKIGETCTVEQETRVAFGAAGKFLYRDLIGSFLCDVATFQGDPNPGKAVKECSIPLADTRPPQKPPLEHPTTGDDECVAGATIKDKTVDCGGRTIGLSCNADDESQPPVLKLINASVKNLRIAANGGSDGIHCNAGNCTLENVVWEDICEDAATHKSEGGTLTIKGGWAYNDASGPGGKPDKVFQHNSKNSTTIVTGGFTLKGQHGKLWRSCGDCKNNGGPRTLIVDDATIEGSVTAGVAGANRNYGDKVKIRNLKIKDYSPGKPSVCDEYIGVNKGEGSSKKLGEFFGSDTCDLRESDIIDPADSPRIEAGRAPRQLTLTGDLQGTHDPVMIRSGDSYYVFSTGKGILMRQSQNLRDWKFVGSVLPELPSWVLERFGNIDIWAPDVSRFGQNFHLYYSVSEFGKNNSCIGLLINDGTDLTRGWRDSGRPVICTSRVDDWNAIDANVVFDADGQPWMSVGSFFSGIKMIKLDPQTGHRSGHEFYQLASRIENSRSVEAPFIVYRNGYYYLFVSFDFCCRGAASTYRTMVGRSKNVFGPYVDKDGRLMTDGGGSLVLQGGNRWKGPGHNSVFFDSRAAYLVYHAYDAEQNGMFSLHISELFWGQGWPYTAPL